jgi:hypothetical protein
VEYFKYLVAMTKNDARGTYRIKSRIVMGGKKGIRLEEVCFRQEIGLQFKEEARTVDSLVWC